MLTAAGRGSPGTSIGNASVSHGSASGISRQPNRGTAISTASHVPAAPHPQQPAAGRQRQLVSAALLEQEPGGTAGAVAACTRLAAIGIEEGEPRVRPFRLLDQHQLVEPDPAPPVADPAHLRFRQPDGLAAGIDHDEIVPEPVHLGEGQRAHAGRIAAKCANCNA